MSNDRIAFDASRAPEYELHVAVGDPIGEHGLTRIALNGGGHMAAEQIFEEIPAEKQSAGAARKPRQAEGQIDVEAATKLMRQVSQFLWDRKFPSRPGIPDEAVVVWTFGLKDGPSLTLKVWLREAEQDPALGPVLRALREGLATVSHGEIYL